MGRKRRKKNIQVKKNVVVNVGAVVGSAEVKTDQNITRAYNKGHNDKRIKVPEKRTKRFATKKEHIDLNGPEMRIFNMMRDNYIVDEGFILPQNIVMIYAPSVMRNTFDKWAQEHFNLQASIFKYRKQDIETAKKHFRKFLLENMNEEDYKILYNKVEKQLLKFGEHKDYLTEMEFELIEAQRDAELDISGMSYGNKDGLWPIMHFFGDTSDTINNAYYQRDKFLANLINEYYDGMPNQSGHTNDDVDLLQYMEEQWNYMQWMIDSVSNIVMQLPPLMENVMMFRGGEFDESLEKGDVGEFKTPTSFSFKKEIAQEYKKGKKWLYVVYAPEGTHVAAMSAAGRFKGYHYHAGEVFNASNQKYVVLDKDTKHRIVTIMFLPHEGVESEA